MSQDAMAIVNGHPQRPVAWKGTEHTYHAWFNETLRLISDLIWPVFDHATRTWRGAATSHMLELTTADLELMRPLYKNIPNAIDLPLTAPLGSLVHKSHHDLFNEEDLYVKNWGNSYVHYDANWKADEIANLQAVLQNGVKTKYGASLYSFKAHLQRPRPYQVSTLLGIVDFNYIEALSADTPSICCGHCMQSLLGVGSVAERLLLNGTKLAPNRVSALRQFAADIGDRRVMARVHYPSDNLCSWLIVMRIANHVFVKPEVKRWLWQAIVKHSHVYRMIKSSRQRVYGPMLRELEAEAAR